MDINRSSKLIDNKSENTLFVGARIAVIGIGHSGSRVINILHRHSSDLFLIDLQNYSGDVSEIIKQAANYDLIFISASLSESNSIDLTPKIVKTLNNNRSLIISTIIMPFSYELEEVRGDSIRILWEIVQNSDSVIVTSSDRGLRAISENDSMLEAKHISIDISVSAIQSFSDILLKPGLINLDFADVISVFRKSSLAFCVSGFGSGEEHELKAMKLLLEDAQRELVPVRKATGVLLNLTISEDETLDSLSTATGILTDMIGDEANVIWSSVIDPDMKDGFKATAIFTGFEYNFDQKDYFPNYLNGLFNKTANQVVSETIGSKRLIVEPKSNKLRKLRVFIASPSDVTGERESLRALIANLNDTVLSYLGLYMELVSWETHAVPDMGRPQSVINRIIDDIDIFIGILWSRIGTPTGTSLSGTLEEFEFAYKSWKQKGTPRIMFYFCDLPPMQRGIEAAKQFLEVEKFKAAFPEKGLYWTYTTIESFANVVRNHLTRIAHQIIA